MNRHAFEISAFLAVGILNTLVGYGVFWIANQTLGLHIAGANALGYAVALTLAYQLNKTVVFRHGAARRGAASIFLICFVIAFLINQAVLLWIDQATDWHPGLVQLLAMAAYTVTFFLLNKFVVFQS